MAHTRSFIYLVLFGVYNEILGADNTAPTAIHAVGVGYHLLRGNPGGADMRHGGEDPGLLMTRHILSQETEDGAATKVIYEPHDSCRTTTSENLVFSPKSYQDYLKQDITFAGTSLSYLQNAAFALSAGYADVKKETSGLHYVLQDNSTTCVIGTARYPVSLSAGNFNYLTDEFAADVCSLPELFDMLKYNAFLDKWGTHFVEEVKIGSRQTTTTVGPRRDYITQVMQKAKDDVSVGGPMDGWASSWVVDYNTLMHRYGIDINFGNSVFTTYTGDISSPEPVGLKLTTIDTTLMPDFWHVGQYPIAQCLNNSDSQSIAKRRQNLIQALQQYAYVKSAEIPKAEPLAMPIVWPEGFTGLPKPKTGCPNLGKEWTEGWLTQTSEVQTPSNAWNVTHMDGSQAIDRYTLRFCMKTVEKEEFSMDWPAGDYCIFKFHTCPKGFQEGFVQWDDDDQANGNAHGGALPDGVYGLDTRINYCCRSDGQTYTPITLPTGKPFYLFQYKNGCQEVSGMRSTVEYLSWDDEDSNHPSHSARGTVYPGMILSNPPQYPGNVGTAIKIYYCYYQKGPSGVNIIG